MSENSEWGGIGCLAPAIGIAGLVAAIMLGPIDLCRSVYNGIIGDTPVLKEQLLDYSRRDIRKKYPSLSNQDVESLLANELNYNLEGNNIDSQKVSIEDLWDLTEVHARSWYQRWIWTNLKDP